MECRMKCRMKMKIGLMNKRSPRQGTALIIALTLSTALLILAGAYITSLRQQGPINPNLLAATQADLLAQGVTQIAILKFKELPAPLYYAGIASRSGYFRPNDTYCEDAIFNNSIPAPFNAVFRTNYQMLSSQMYKEMNVKIIVTVTVTYGSGKDGKPLTMQKKYEHIINGTRTLTN
ncbi:MAG: hypothetical protein WA705_30710 [Candidatus Ozemobacteraceae bacterium]